MEKKPKFDYCLDIIVLLIAIPTIIVIILIVIPIVLVWIVCGWFNKLTKRSTNI